MEPIHSDLEYVAHERESDPRKRFNWLYLFPALGVLWVLYLVVSVIFQLPVSGIVDPVMSFMIVVLFLFAGGLFWAVPRRANR